MGLAGIVAATGSIDPEMRAVLYAPFVPGGDPTSGVDLYGDNHTATFRRDAWVLSQVGATTLLLNPWHAGSNHQGLYNATSLKVLRPLDEDENWKMLSLQPQEALIAELNQTLKLIPSLSITPATLGLADFMGGAGKVGLDASKLQVRDFVCSALQAAPNVSSPYAAKPFGGGNWELTKKDATQAFNFLVLPEDESRRWPANAWDGSDMIAYTALETLAGVVKDASCPGLDQFAELGVLPPPPPVIVTISDLGGDVGPATLLPTFIQHLVANVTSVGGVVIPVSRSRRCDASDVVRAAIFAAGQADREFSLWFSVGVDAFNDPIGAPYVPVHTSNDHTANFNVTDGRTQCLMHLIQTVEDTCNDPGEPSSGEPSSGPLVGIDSWNPGNIKCGLIVQEYSDSLWRAGLAGTPSSAAGSGQECAVIAQGAPLGASIAWGEPMAQTPPGVRPPASDDFLEEHLSCGNLIRVPNDPGPVQPFINLPNVTVHASQLPGYLLCDPQQELAIVPYTNSKLLPRCGQRNLETLDDWHNVAWDGLMEPVPPTMEDFCNDRFHQVESSLRPRRAFYALRERWARSTSEVTSIRDWPAFQAKLAGLAERNDQMLNDDAGLTLVLFAGYFAAFVLIVPVLLACFRSTGIKGRLTVTAVAFVLYLLNWTPLPVPCTITWDLAADLLSLFLFISLWAPLNGGGGRGQWWWVHFALAVMLYQLSDGRHTYVFHGTCQRTYPIFTLSARIVDAITLNAEHLRLLAPPADVCRSGLCCVATADNEFFPWSSRMPIPQLWQPYLPWNVVLTILVLTLLIVVVGMLFCGCACQLVWLTWNGRRKVGLPKRAATATPQGEMARKTLKLGGVLESLSEGCSMLQAHFGDHFSPDSYKTSEKLVAEMVKSRARRSEGYEVQKAVEQQVVLEPVRFTGDQVASRLPSVRPATVATSTEVEATAPAPAEAQPAESSTDPKRRSVSFESEDGHVVPLTQLTELYDELTSNLHAWMAEVRFGSEATAGPVFGSTARLLEQRFSRPDTNKYDSLDEIMAKFDWSDREQRVKLWAILQLYLLVGSDNFFRSAPGAINLLFAIHACHFFWGKEVSDLPTDTPSRVGIPPMTRQTLSAQQFLVTGADETDAALPDLANFRDALYLLHRTAGSTLGNRVDTLFKEKTMNYDDLAELCTNNGAKDLFAGLEHLALTLHSQAKIRLKWTQGLIVYFNQDVDENPLVQAQHILKAARALWKNLERLAGVNVTQQCEALFDKLSGLMDNLQRELLRAASSHANSRSNSHPSSEAARSSGGEPRPEDVRGSLSSPEAVLQRLNLAQDTVRLEQEQTSPSHNRKSITALVREAMQYVLLVLQSEGLSSVVKSLGDSPLDVSTDTVLDSVTGLLETMSGAKLEELKRKEAMLSERLANPRPSASRIMELFSIVNETKSALVALKLGPCSDTIANPVRFTWGHDSHKTVHDYRMGYAVVVLEMWFLWKTLLLASVAGAVYLTGGYLGWFTSRLLEVASNVLTGFLNISMPAPTFFSWSMTSLVGTSYAGNWLLYALLLGVANDLFELVVEVMWLARALGTTGTMEEHRYWRVSREARAAYDENALLGFAWQQLCSCYFGATGSKLPEDQPAMQPRRTRRTAVQARQLRNVSMEDKNFRELSPGTELAGGAIDVREDVEAADFGLLKEGDARARPSELRRAYHELYRIAVRPIKYVVARVCLVVMWAMLELIHQVTCFKAVLRAFPRAVLIRSARVLMRLAWLYLYLFLWTRGKPDNDSTEHSQLFAFALFLRGWFAIFSSLFDGVFARIAPTDFICGMYSSALFGWYYSFCGPPWRQELQPRERRTYKDATLSTLFVGSVMGLWILYTLPQIRDLVLALYQITMLSSELLFASGQLTSNILHGTLLVLVVVFRIGYAAFYALALMQLFFAIVLAVAGAITAASTSIFGWLGSVWDRTQGLGKEQILEAAHGFMRRRPSKIIFRNVTELAVKDQEIALFSRMWNEGLLPDMQRAHQIDIPTAKKLRIGGKGDIAADLRSRDPRAIPDLQVLTSSLCFDARRRVHDFLSFARRTHGVPVAPMVRHMPSVTILMPAFSETMLRSWPSMFEEKTSWKLSDVRYMIEKRNDEFRCLRQSLGPNQQKLLSRFVAVEKERSGGNPPQALVQYHRLRDAFWFSEYLLAIFKGGALEVHGDAPNSGCDPRDVAPPHLSTMLQIARLMLDCALLPSAAAQSIELVLPFANDDVQPGPAAPTNASLESLLELAERRRAMEQAAALGVPCLDELARLLLEPATSKTFDEARALLEALQPGLAQGVAENALVALGVSRTAGWAPEATMADDSSRHSGRRGLSALGEDFEGQPTRLCLELHRVRCEIDVKVALRKWFSNREQSVWRTIEGLSKIEGGLLELHQLEATLTGERLPRALPDGIIQCIASFQIYDDYRKKQRANLAKCQKLATSVNDPNNVGSPKWYEDVAALRKGLFGGADGLMPLSHQIDGVHQALHEFSGPGRSLRTAYLNNRPDGTSNSRLCSMEPLIMDARCQPVLSESSGTNDRLELAFDANCQLMLLRTMNNLELPGNPVLHGIGEGKPTNQAHAMLHVTSELLMLVDMNQGVDLEQTFFLPSMLTKFHTNDKGKQQPKKNVRVVGFRENIFTEADGVVANSGAINEYVFGTIMQRQMYITLNVRLHYGHPDCFDYAFALTNGTTSKSSKTYNMSEDVFGGMNVFLRGGKNVYVDYVQVDKGRDVQYDAALSFEQKIASGTAMGALTRDMKRLMRSPLCFFHKISLFLGSVGIFFSNTMLAYAIVTLVSLNATAAMMPRDFQKLLYLDTKVVISLLNLGFVYVFALVVQKMGEQGIIGGLRSCGTVLVTIPLNLAKIKIHAYAVHRSLAGGVSKYIGTGRELATTRSDFVNVYKRYNLSHLTPALDLFVLIIIFFSFSTQAVSDRIGMSLAPLIVSLSWLLAPAIYNPFGFSMDAVHEDWRRWQLWISSNDFLDNFYGQKSGQRTGDFLNSNWFFWLNCFDGRRRLFNSLANFVMWACLFVAILFRVVDYDPTTQGAIHAQFDQVIVLFLVALVLILIVELKRGILQVVIFFTITVLAIAALLEGRFLSFILLLYPFGRLLSHGLEILLLGWSTRPWRAYDSDVQGDVVSSAEMLVLPRNSSLLTSLAVRSMAKLHAMIIALMYFGITFIIAIVCMLPISFAALLFMTWSFYQLITLVAHSIAMKASYGDAGWFVICVVFLVLPVSIVFYLLQGQTQRRRAFRFSLLRFYMQTFNVNTLHHWFIFNPATARDIAECTAEDDWLVEGVTKNKKDR